MAVLCVNAIAQDYPNRPIRFISPFPAGSGVDIAARIIGQEMTERWGKPVVVDNRSGASGIIGAEIAARSTPDGYTLIMGNVSTHAININVMKKLPYHPVKDFAPITLVAVLPEILLVHPSVPASSIKELIALAKAKPGQLTFGSAGNWTGPHMESERLKLLAGIDIVHVPYKGSAAALTDLLGGRITMYFTNMLSAAPYIQSGKLRALGVSGAKRSIAAPDVPTIAEAGVPGYEEYNWYGVLAPAGTPKNVVGKLNQTIVQILKTPEMNDRLTKQGLDVVADSPQEFARFIQQQIEKYAKLIRDSGLNVE